MVVGSMYEAYKYEILTVKLGQYRNRVFAVGPWLIFMAIGGPYCQSLIGLYRRRYADSHIHTSVYTDGIMPVHADSHIPPSIPTALWPSMPAAIPTPTVYTTPTMYAHVDSQCHRPWLFMAAHTASSHIHV